MAKKKNTKPFIDRFDLEELAAHLTGLSEQEDYDNSDIEEKLIEQYGIDLENFYELAGKLGALLDMAVSPLTEEPFIGFGTGNMWIAKRPFPTFINQVLIWMSAEQIRDGKGRAYEREINSGGKTEFKLVLMKGDQEYKLIEPEAASAPKGLIGHPADELPPMGSSDIDQQFEMSETYPARVIDLESGEEEFELVYYSYRKNHWMHSREGEEIEVLEWYSRKEASNG